MAEKINNSVGSYESGAVNNESDVVTVQRLLTNASVKQANPAFHPGSTDGKIHRTGSKSGTVRAITAFQTQRVQLNRPDQRIDVGGKTWRQLVADASGTNPVVVSASTEFAKELVKAAEGEVGTMEDVVNNTGAELLKYKQATWLAPGAWAWCAAFVCWCYQEALKNHPIANLKRPQTAGAWDFENWASQQSKVALHKPPGSVQAGDIVVFTFSHIGIAVEDESGGFVTTVEGNTNVKGTRDGGGKTRDGVYRKHRSKSQIRSVIRTVG